jgi:hypothetical protein
MAGTDVAVLSKSLGSTLLKGLKSPDARSLGLTSLAMVGYVEFIKVRVTAHRTHTSGDVAVSAY